MRYAILCSILLCSILHAAAPAPNLVNVTAPSATFTLTLTMDTANEYANYKAALAQPEADAVVVAQNFYTNVMTRITSAMPAFGATFGKTSAQIDADTAAQKAALDKAAADTKASLTTFK